MHTEICHFFFNFQWIKTNILSLADQISKSFLVTQIKEDTVQCMQYELQFSDRNKLVIKVRQMQTFCSVFNKKKNFWRLNCNHATLTLDSREINAWITRDSCWNIASMAIDLKVVKKPKINRLVIKIFSCLLFLGDGRVSFFMQIKDYFNSQRTLFIWYPIVLSYKYPWTNFKQLIYFRLKDDHFKKCMSYGARDMHVVYEHEQQM